MNINQIQESVKFALHQLVMKESALLRLDSSERSITHKLAEYIQIEVGDAYNVDCEYNRHEADHKRLCNDIEKEAIMILQSQSSEPKKLQLENLIYPDIIVHCRENDDNNLCAIEVKKRTNTNSSNDIKKLQCYTRAKYKYKVGLQIIINTGDSGDYNQMVIHVYEKGVCVKMCDIDVSSRPY